MRDNLPRKPNKKEWSIINLDVSAGDGTHWVAYIKNDAKTEYFDSFGNLAPPSELIKYVGGTINYNYNRYQNYNTFNCGHLCIQFLYDNSKFY